MKNIEKNKNTTMNFITKGAYTSVLIARAKEFAEQHNYYFIKFGMDMQETIDVIQEQVRNIPEDVKRIVIPVGSGINFCSVICGLRKYKRDDIQVVGVRVGKDPMNLINGYYPFFSYSKHKIIRSEYDYETQIEAKVGDILLDPIYESKCYKYLEDNDLFWIVGHRKYD